MTKIEKKPNVLWIFADQLRHHALSCNGDENIKTPHIDRLAREGVNCTSAFSQYPVCTPFRAGLMTGLHATECGVPQHGDFLAPNTKTIAHTFRDQGYQTTYVGKWHLAGERGTHLVSDAGWAGEDFWVHPSLRGGFENWFGFNVSNNYYRTFYCSTDKLEATLLKGYQTDSLTDLSLSLLEEANPDSPWFHVISYESPHPGQGGTAKYKGYPVPKKFEDSVDPISLKLRKNVPADYEHKARHQLAGYYGLIANLDENVGRILTWLDDKGLSEDTIVVFFSDHGEMAGSHGLRNKQVPYDESIHIPLIFRYPKKLKQNSSYKQLMSGLDIYPTTVGLAGLNLTTKVQGFDHTSSFLEETSIRESVLVQWNGTRFSFGDHPYRAIRTQTHTYVQGRDHEFCMLFDNVQDPYQMNNLFYSNDNFKLKQSLHKQLLTAVTQQETQLPDYIIAEHYSHSD